MLAKALATVGALPSFNHDRQVERFLLMEPSLCYRLLRVANSAAYGFRHRISTIQAALHVVGEDAFRRLVTVVLASNLAHSGRRQGCATSCRAGLFL